MPAPTADAPTTDAPTPDVPPTNRRAFRRRFVAPRTSVPPPSDCCSGPSPSGRACRRVRR